MIENIIIKSVASYDRVGTQLSGLKKVNFVYGANGSGKTTISNLSSGNANSEFENCQVKWMHGQSLNCLVYNKKFREDNFGKGKIEGVFTLGEATKEDLSIIQIKQEELKSIKEEGSRKRETLDKQIKAKSTEEASFKEHLWSNIYSKNKDEFKEAFKGALQKESFKSKVLSEFSSNKSSIRTLDELKELSKTIFGEAPESIGLIGRVEYKENEKNENDSVWVDKVFGKTDIDISRLINKLNIIDWVNQGREYIQGDATCPFCQKATIDKGFRGQLESFFDETFTDSTNRIAYSADEYARSTGVIVSELKRIEIEQSSNEGTKLDVEKYSVVLKALLSEISANKLLIAEKIKEPSRSIPLKSTRECFIAIDSLLESANEEIQKHNGIVTNYKSERARLVQEIWKYLIEENRVAIELHRKKIAGLESGISKLNSAVEEKINAYKALNNEIRELTKNVTSIQPTIDEINKILKYYGFDSFEIVPSSSSEGHYQIKRQDGELAESTLSEGEVTFITFLYYFQLAKGSTDKDRVTDERVLIVDDPISSLDSNVLFVVSTLIKSVINDIKGGVGNIKQIIILTHNVYFHKEVSFIDGRTKEHSQTNYWILRKNNNVSSAQPFLTKNPIQTSYELLWNEIKNVERNSSVTIQNTMRRIIESYFKILGGYRDSDLVKKFASKEEQEIFRSLVSWVNDGSHSISDDLFIEAQTEVVDKYLKVFRDIFVLTKHEGHYDMMMGFEDGAKS